MTCNDIQMLRKGAISEDIISTILAIHRNYYEGDVDDLEQNLLLHREDIEHHDSRIIVIRLDTVIVGYLLVIPQIMARDKYSKGFDPELRGDDNYYYVDTMEILQTKSNNYLFFLNLIAKGVKEAREHGASNFSLHLRSKISKKMVRILKQKLSAEIRIVRAIKGNWYGTEEDYDYVELNFLPL